MGSFLLNGGGPRLSWGYPFDDAILALEAGRLAMSAQDTASGTSTSAMVAPASASVRYCSGCGESLRTLRRRGERCPEGLNGAIRSPEVMGGWSTRVGLTGRRNGATPELLMSLMRPPQGDAAGSSLHGLPVMQRMTGRPFHDAQRVSGCHNTTRASCTITTARGRRRLHHGCRRRAGQSFPAGPFCGTIVAATTPSNNLPTWLPRLPRGGCTTVSPRNSSNTSAASASTARRCPPPSRHRHAAHP